jgi:two-component system, chemotaxis family, protein-glutamate methylesterase/glutaminase
MSDPSGKGPLRVLVVDDSAFNRRSISDILATDTDIEVVGKAADGEEALRLIATLRPDVITLDLEMPRMDGFTFLRILMTKMPLPVIVVSSYSQKENVFKALELGALDFIAKPDRYIDPDLVGLREDLVRKVQLARSVRSAQARKMPEFPSKPVETRQPAAGPPRHVVAVASSTGGPSAIIELFAKLPRAFASALVIAQHMPDKFTRTFAERLDRRGPLRTAEAADGDAVEAGTAFVCPGRQCMEVEMGPKGYRIRLKSPDESDRYVPSADRLMRSVARTAGRRAVGVVLTGMGDDGLQGARAIVEAGGIVVAESEESAVVYGMPGAVVRAGLASMSLPLADLGEWLSHL